MTAFTVPEPDLQIEFYSQLSRLRHTCLLEALLDVVSELDIPTIDSELKKLVSSSALRRTAGWGLRGEVVFPTPHVLKAAPKLLGYYRLLMGFSQKQFYGGQHGFGPFKSMEEAGRLTENNLKLLEDLCRALCSSAERLLEGIPRMSHETAHELTLLTLGPQLRGGALNLLGSRATRKIFNLISAIAGPSIIVGGQRSIELKNAAGRIMKVEFASDPDICIREKLPSGKYRNLVAIEIKGGRDHSNIHNRIGEAEKSHQKARKQGYVECWTLVGVADLNMELAERESPTTDRFFHIDRITDEASEDFEDFRENLLSRLGARYR